MKHETYLFNNMGKFLDNIPTSSLELVNYSGSELLNRLGKDIISNVA
jgi:hypothetical protein